MSATSTAQNPGVTENGSRLKAGTTLNMWKQRTKTLRLALGVEHRRTHGFRRGLAGPHHELECRVIALAGVDGADQHALALRGRGGEAAGQHQRLPVHDHAGMGPDTVSY